MAKRPSMACARRAVGQRSVSKPKALGPAANISRTSALWVDDKRLGRPGALRLRRWSNPCPSRVRYQREAVVRLTPNLRATRACVIPWSRSPAASRRLRSISSRFNVTGTAAYIPSRADFWPEQSQYTPKHFRCKLIFHVWGKFLGEGPEVQWHLSPRPRTACVQNSSCSERRPRRIVSHMHDRARASDGDPPITDKPPTLRFPRTGLPGRLLVQRGFSRHGPDDFARAFPQFPRNPREPVREMLGFKTDASAR